MLSEHLVPCTSVIQIFIIFLSSSETALLHIVCTADQGADEKIFSAGLASVLNACMFPTNFYLTVPWPIRHTEHKHTC
jgi:hypothetical protein